MLLLARNIQASMPSKAITALGNSRPFLNSSTSAAVGIPLVLPPAAADTQAAAAEDDYILAEAAGHNPAGLEAVVGHSPGVVAGHNLEAAADHILAEEGVGRTRLAVGDSRVHPVAAEAAEAGNLVAAVGILAAEVDSQGHRAVGVGVRPSRLCCHRRGRWRRGGA